LTTFDVIPHLWYEKKCLVAIAQKYNYNMQRSIRQQTTISASPEHQTDSICQNVMEPLWNITEPLLSEAEPADELKPFRV
jgi:hypothetical protein